MKGKVSALLNYLISDPYNSRAGVGLWFMILKKEKGIATSAII
jgi:hypothetical protein